MNSRINAKNILFALRHCNKIKMTNAIFADCGYFHIEVIKNVCYVSYSNLNTTISISFATTGNDIFFRMPLKIIGLFKNSDFVDITKEGSEIKLEFESGISIKYNDPDTDYKHRTFMDGDYQNLLIADVSFFKTLSEASLFTTSDEMRPAMTGINLVYKNGEVNIAASDGHTLVKYNHTINPTHEDVFDIVITKELAKFLGSFKTIKEDIEFCVYKEKQYCSINFIWADFNFEIKSRLISQRYPDFNAVINIEKSVNSVTFNKSEMIIGLKSSLMFSEYYTPLKIYPEKNILYINNLDTMVEYQYKINLLLSGELKGHYEGSDRNAFAFNAIYLLRCVEVCEPDEKGNIALHFENVNKPFLCTSKQKTVLIMPVIIY